MKKIILTTILLCAFVFKSQAQEVSGQVTQDNPQAQIYIKVGEAQTKKSLIALPPLQFVGNPAAATQYQSVGAELFRVMQNDLNISNYFQFIPQSSFLEDTTKLGIKPAPADPNGFKFDTWKQIGAEFLIRAQFSIIGDMVTVNTMTYHVNQSKLILGKNYKGPVAATRRIAHTFANDILEALTGTKGMFLSRIAVSSDRNGGGFREVYIMDWDGSNMEKITNHRSVTLSPSWSPDGTKVAYTAFVQRSKTKTRNADMFIYELLTGKRWLVSYRQRLNSGSNFAPDNQHLYLTLSQNGSPDIYKMTYDGNLVSRLTTGPRGAMNVEPASSADNKKIAFSSDRSGQPMIYVMNSDGSNPKRLTFAGKYNSTPTWSPDGSKIAFSGWSDDHFDIFLMNSDGSNMIRITSIKKSNGKWANNEDPVFSPDGRLLMYTSNRSGSNQIYISNLDGTEERRVTQDTANYFKPKWSINIE